MQNDNNENIPDGQVKCFNCGAVHSVDDPRCPYCGALNPVGAEKAYMNELDDLKDETDQLAEDAEDDFGDSVQSNAKRIALIVVAVVAAIAVMFFAYNCMERHDERQEVKSYQARESFRQQHFQELDRLYEAGDDAALSEYAWSLADEPGFDALFSWEHVDYLEVYNDWETIKFAQSEFHEGKGDIEDYAWTVSIAIELARLDESGQRTYDQLTDAEEKRAAEYRAFAWEFLEDTLQMNKEEITAFAASVLDDEGSVDDKKLKRNLEPRLRELGTIR